MTRRTNIAWPGRPPVPGTLHADFRSRLGGPPDEADRRLVAWYETVSAEYTGQPIGDNDFEFWRARFKDWQGSTVTRASPMMGAGRTAGNVAALQTVLNRKRGADVGR